jgi:hypothetical protein
MHLRWRLKKDASRLGECICFDIGRNGCHQTSSFFLFAVCVEAIGCPLGVLGSRGILSLALYGSCWLSIPEKLGCGVDSQGVALSQVCAFAFRIY